MLNKEKLVRQHRNLGREYIVSQKFAIDQIGDDYQELNYVSWLTMPSLQEFNLWGFFSYHLNFQLLKFQKFSVFIFNKIVICERMYVRLMQPNWQMIVYCFFMLLLFTINYCLLSTGIKKYVVGLIIKTSSDPSCVEVSKSSLGIRRWSLQMKQDMS